MPSIDEQKQALNRYYFEEFLPELPTVLQALATDPLVLFHRDLPNPLSEVTQLVRNEYWLSPWFLSDIFPLDDERIAIANRGFLPVLLSYLVLDHLVDGQTPDSPLIPLLSHQYYFAAAREFSKLFRHEDDFWQVWYSAIKSHADGLSIEYRSVVQLNPPLTEAIMREVAIGKAMPFRLVAEIMGRLSQQEDLIPLISEVYRLHLLADQFYDDANDYQEDWEEKRVTLSHVYLAEAVDISISDLLNLDVEHLRQFAIKHRIQEKMMQQSTKLLQEALNLLGEQQADTRLAALLRERLEMDKAKMKAFQGKEFLQRLKNSLK